jgi:hypothetical protein
MYRRRLRELFRLGRRSLLIGLAVLTGAIALAHSISVSTKNSGIAEIIRESLTIGGWVSMWRPLEVFLYDWWPIRDQAQLSDRLASMPVRIRYLNAAGSGTWKEDWPAVFRKASGRPNRKPLDRHRWSPLNSAAPTADELEVAKHQGGRVTRVVAALKAAGIV